jgi:hypothetical protein
MTTTPSRGTAEHARLAEAAGWAEDNLSGANPWYEWGPYLSERAWGTVREDYSDNGAVDVLLDPPRRGHRMNFYDETTTAAEASPIAAGPAGSR